jgi:hypothetical protein
MAPSAFGLIGLFELVSGSPVSTLEEKWKRLRWYQKVATAIFALAIAVISAYSLLYFFERLGI